MTTYIYRWQELGNEQTGEIDGPLLEIRGDAKSIFAVSKRLELPVRPFESEFLNLDETPADIFEALDAQTSDEKDEQRLADAEDRLWTRVGDAGDYYDHFSLEEMVDTLNDLQVGKVDHWVAGYPGFGFATPNYHGHDFVSCAIQGLPSTLASTPSNDHVLAVSDNYSLTAVHPDNHVMPF